MRARCERFVFGSGDSTNYLFIADAAVVAPTNLDKRPVERDESPERPSGRKSLDSIAEELIGTEALPVTEDDESVVGRAKRNARRQQRDPAIDRRLRD